jgi:hypothetical protein
MPSKICAFNLQSAKNRQNPPNRAALNLHPLGEIPIHPNLPAAPEQLVASGSRDGAKRSEKERKKKEAQPPSGEWTHSKCSLNDLNKLVSEGLLQDKNLVNWRPSFYESFLMENVDEIIIFYHFGEWGFSSISVKPS